MSKLTAEIENNCMQCGKVLFGRRDKKYCNDECRNKANGMKRKREKWDEPPHVYQISRDLIRNRKIMLSTGVSSDEPKIVTRGMLLDKGFNFEYYTNLLRTKKGDYYYCYEFGYMELANGKLLIVMTDRYYEFKFSVNGSF